MPDRLRAALPFICFDLAGGANLVGSEVLVGVQGGQSNFLSTAGYGKLGVPGNMVPELERQHRRLARPAVARRRRHQARHHEQGDHAGDGRRHQRRGVLRDVAERHVQTTRTTRCTASPKAGAQGQLLTLIGTESSVSGGNSQAPMALIDPSLQPTTINQPSDATALVNTGGATADPVAVAVLESQARISGGYDAAVRRRRYHRLHRRAECAGRHPGRHDLPDR